MITESFTVAACTVFCASACHSTDLRSMWWGGAQPVHQTFHQGATLGFESPESRKRRRPQLSDEELHDAKRRLSEKMWGLRLDEAGTDAAQPLQDPGYMIEESDEDESSQEAEVKMTDDDAAHAALVNFFKKKSSSSTSNIDQKIEDLIRRSIYVPRAPGTLLALCDAPWSEIEEGKAARMDTSTEMSDECAPPVEVVEASAVPPVVTPPITPVPVVDSMNLFGAGQPGQQAMAAQQWFSSGSSQMGLGSGEGLHSFAFAPPTPSPAAFESQTPSPFVWSAAPAGEQQVATGWMPSPPVGGCWTMGR